MKKYTMGEIAKMLDGELVLGTTLAEVDSVCHDSREAKEKNLFFAIVGDNKDGHEFIEGAANSGCRSFVISDASHLSKLNNLSDINVILVKNTTIALGDLAREYLKSMKVQIIGITGSTGKTSTKDLLYHVCKTKFKTACTQGNFNNHIGLPLTVLSFLPDTEVGILEMGMDKLGEIDYLTTIAPPNIAVITNVGVSHLENLGTRENIFKAKMEITNRFTAEGLLIVPIGRDFLTPQSLNGEYRVEFVGIDQQCDYMLESIVDRGESGTSFDLTHTGFTNRFSIGVPGKHNVINAGLAIAVAMELGIEDSLIAKGLSTAELTGARLAIDKVRDIKIIDDTYNASPDSTKAALDLLKAIKGGKKIAVVGDMYELGKEEIKLHKQVGEYGEKKGIDQIIGVGRLGKHIAEGADKVGLVTTKESVVDHLIKAVKKGDVVLFKASRSMALEKTMEEFKNELRKNAK